MIEPMESRKRKGKKKKTRKPNTTLVATEFNSQAPTVLCSSLKPYLF